MAFNRKPRSGRERLSEPGRTRPHLRRGLARDVEDAPGIRARLKRSERQTGQASEREARVAGGARRRIKTKMSRSAIYIRVSTQKQADKFSIPAQLRILTDHCKTLKTEYMVYNEGGVSGETIEERPQIQKLLHDAQKGLFDTCLVIELERLSRSDDLLDWLIIKKVFKQNNIAIATPNQRFDLKDEEDDFLSDLFGALSKREKRKILKRMERGRIEASRKGNCIVGGKSKFGYDYNPLTKRLDINPSEAETVRKIFSAYLGQDSSTKKIAVMLNREKVSSKYGAGWDNARIRRILRDTTYFGEWHYNKRTGKTKGKLKPQAEWIKVAIPAIIDKETFDKTQKLIETRRYVRYQTPEAVYLLKDLLVCGTCGSKFHPLTKNDKFVRSKNKDKHISQYQFYRCAGREISHSDCRMSRIRASILEELVWNKVMELVKNPAPIREAVAKEAAAIIVDKSALGAASDEASRELGTIQEQERRMLEAYRKEVISIDQLEIEIGRIKADKARLEKRLQELREGAAKVERLFTEVNRLIVALKTVRVDEASDIWGRCRLMKEMVLRVIVTEKSEVRLEGRLSAFRYSQDLTAGSGKAIFDRYLFTHLDGESSNGRTTDSGSVYRGSNPFSPD